MIVENQLRTSQIVAAYVRKNLVSTDQIAGLINSVHLTLAGLGNNVAEEPPLVPAVSIRRSVHADYIICLECGYKGKMLKKHLQSRHGLSVAEYRTRWKLSYDHPMTAANYSEQRSQLAKSIGLGRRSSAAMPAVASETTPEKPARRRSASKATATRTSAAKASPKKVSAKAAAQKANARTSAAKASPKKVSAKNSSAKKASPKPSARKANNGSRSRKPSSRAASKAASAPEAATA
jgi:predicted transcriptional regulator